MDPVKQPVRCPGSGLCECGCGEQTELASRTRSANGHIKGQPKRFVHGHENRKPDRYEVDEETGCWVWQKGCTPDGYGKRWTAGRGHHSAHRYFYEQHKGPIPDGLHIDHLCRNRACVNPDHLEAVTPAENCRRGLSAKLTQRDVLYIRSAEESSPLLAQRFGITRNYVDAVRRGASWSDV